MCAHDSFQSEETIDHRLVAEMDCASCEITRPQKDFQFFTATFPDFPIDLCWPAMMSQLATKSYLTETNDNLSTWHYLGGYRSTLQDGLVNGQKKFGHR